MCSISRAFEREKYVDFTTATYFDWVSFFTPKPTIKSKNWLVTNPFTNDIWILIFTSFVAYTILIYITLCKQTDQISFVNIFTIIFGSLLARCKFFNNT